MRIQSVVEGGADPAWNRLPSNIVGLLPPNGWVEGYTDRLSVTAGDSIGFKINAPLGHFELTFYRVSGIDQYMMHMRNMVGNGQGYPSTAYKDGAGWTETFKFSVPETWQSGIYYARLYDRWYEKWEDLYRIWFVVKPALAARKIDLGVLISTNTWHAYNEWGGNSLYTSQGLATDYVSFERPSYSKDQRDKGHLVEGDRFILGWLDTQGYEYATLSDFDLHNDGIDSLTGFKSLIIDTHNEYWTEKMYNALQQFRDQGGNLLCLGGNTGYRRVEINGTQMYRPQDPECYWHKKGRPASGLLGVQLNEVKYAAMSGFGTPMPYQVIADDHFAFAGTGLVSGEVFGQVGNNQGGQLGGHSAAVGWETDNIDDTSLPNPNLKVLARGINSQGQGEMVFIEPTNNSGSVFSVGSITFGGSLVVDYALSQIVINILNHLGHSPNT